ncbi:MAG: GAF domain-containing protein [Deltaproteobacteria bacterium]|nr:GAF domain-containing protein [Deltaproteobacteria bacterium]
MSNETKITIKTFKTVTKAIAQSDNLDIMTNHLCQLLVTALGIKACAIYLLDLETNELEPLASFGLTPGYLAKGPLTAKRSLADTLEGKPVIVADVANDTRVQYPQEAQKEGIGAMLSLPVMSSGGILGAVRLYHSEPWHISDEDLESLLLLCDYIGLAMTFTSLLNAVQSIYEVIRNDLPVAVSPAIKN